MKLPSLIMVPAALTCVLLIASLLVPLSIDAASNSDDFNDNSKSNSKWDADVNFGRGRLMERNQRLEYTVSDPSVSVDEAHWPWKLTRFPAGADWEFQMDTFNITTPNLSFQVNSMGFSLRNVRDGDDEIFAELYSSSLGGNNSARTGFVTEIATDDEDVGSVDVLGGEGVTDGAIRMTYNGATKVVTVFYDRDLTDGYQWVLQASFGLAGSGGADANTDWGLASDDQLALSVYGYSEGMAIASGQMFVDNFMETGGVTPSGLASPVPVGNFRFVFPTNHPLATVIASLTGNYRGVTPMFVENNVPRNYNMDVAQDESGKLMTMGTIDGLANADGSTEISTAVGEVATVNNKPTVRVNTSFTGTADGMPVKTKTTGSGPAEIVDIGGGSNDVSTTMVSMTMNISAKTAGVPFKLRNTPVMLPGSDFAPNLQKSWSLDLDISRKLVKGKERTVASARLHLPNGDTIAYPEKAVRYSAKKGYNLSFKRGTNITANPQRTDRKSAVSLKRLTFVQEGDNWRPTGGTITYQFLGQKGTGDVADFLAP